MRFRNVFLAIGSVLTILLLLMSDPDVSFVQNLPFGSGTLSLLIILLTSILYVGIFHLSRYKEFQMRFRHIFIGLGSLLTVLVLLMSDPDVSFVQNLPFGSGTLSLLIILLTSILYVGILHLSRKALIDYIDLEAFFKQALKTPEGAGSAVIGIGLIMISIAIVIHAATK